MIKTIIKNIAIYSIAAFVGGAVAGWAFRGRREKKSVVSEARKAA
jgi:hypothetical protein